ncbi:phage tail sheath family protein [Paenibacillus apiarius]|uniref:phage tail sheath family protein n=1 Tax=Paenibacillus apiarius TaxID=46240 RepID=UPI003B3B3602
MSENHGVYVSEKPYTPPASEQENVTVPVVIGTAPIHLSKLSVPPVNTPVLLTSWGNGVETFGYSDDWKSFTLCEFMYSHFQLYKQSPVVFINVLDPEKHKTKSGPIDVEVIKNVAILNANGIIKNSVVVKSSDGATTYELDKDYTLTFDESGRLIVTTKQGGAAAAETSLKVEYEKLDPGAVKAADIIGGIDANTGQLSGMELIKQVFPRFQLVTGLLLAPGFSHDPVVAAVMNAKAALINGNFKATAITDLPASLKYNELDEWKEKNNYTSPQQINTWPKVTRRGMVYHLSTHLAGVICKLDLESGGIPYRSPSNKSLEIDGAVQEDGTIVAIGPDEGKYINSLGIVTALNFIGGWVSWGNRTGAYPDATDPQSAFIPVRRMFNWWNNTIILTQWSKVDEPANKRLVEAVVDDLGIRLNGLQSSEYILGGWIQFAKEDNPDAATMDGKLVFRTAITPPSPGQELAFTVEYDAQMLSAIGG